MNLLQALVLVGSVLAVVALPNENRRSGPPTVDLGYSINQATSNDTGKFYTFSNIRFAEPPVGNLRFAAPIPPQTANRTVNNGSVSFICPQAYPNWILAAEGLSGPLPTDPRTNEDCLFLDVYVPQAVFERGQSRSKTRGSCGAPVLVWIYGGGYTLGEKSGTPAGLIAASQKHGNEGIIYVAMNYRLGLFGFLAGSTFESSGGTSNAGLWDQRLAIEWVQKYIHLFGGDPSSVTVIGESAGAGSLMHQITAFGGKEGKVPFQQAILQSPGFAPLPNNDQSETVYSAVLQAADVSSLQQLRSLSTEQLQQVNTAITARSEYGLFTFGPAVDGNFSPDLPGKLLLKGGFDRSLKLLIGHNSHEGDLFTAPVQNESSFDQNVRDLFPDISPSAFAYITQTLYPPDFSGAYGYTSAFGRSSQLWGEVVFVCNTNYLARAYGSQTYNYVFSVPPGIHGEDIPYTFYDGPSASVTNVSIALTLQDYITAFVETGSPNTSGEPAFPEYGSQGIAQNFNVTGVRPILDPGNNPRCYWLQNALYA